MTTRAFTSAVLAALLVSAPDLFAQSGSATSGAAMIPLAVVEFTPGPNASAMTAETKRQLQASIAFELHDTRRFDVHDVRRTREASMSQLTVLNDDASTNAAARLGKQLGVSHVLTGMVMEYSPQGDGGIGHATLHTRLVEVATGKVVHSEQFTKKSKAPMNGSGAAEMQAKVLKPASRQLAAAILAKF